MAGSADSATRIQYGILPWRKGPQGLEVLLITTRNTRRWLVPKGWPSKSRSPQEGAVREAFEEAGVLGKVGVEPIGSFRYRKRRKSGEVLHCKVVLFAMETTEQKPTWPEKELRECVWCAVPDAAARVSFKSLGKLIRLLEQHLGVRP